MKHILATLPLFALIACVAFAATTRKPGNIPAELLGEWATSKSTFSRGALTSGSAVYLFADGMTGVIGAPPPIGIRGEATYDTSAFMLTITLLDDDHGGHPRGVLVFVYDPRARTLSAVSGESKDEVFRRRSDQVPDHILKELHSAMSRSGSSKGIRVVPAWSAEDVWGIRSLRPERLEIIRATRAPDVIGDIVGYFRNAHDTGKDRISSWTHYIDVEGRAPVAGYWYYNASSGEFKLLGPAPQQGFIYPVFQLREMDKRQFELALWIAVEDNFYRVRAGDTAIQIARNHDLQPSELAALNPNVRWGMLLVGQKLRVRAEERGKEPNKSVSSKASIPRSKH